MTLTTLILLLILPATMVSALDFQIGEKAYLLSEKSGWFPTGADNSLTKDVTLFQFLGKGLKRTINTNSTLTNIHDHYRRDQAGRLKNYLYTGQMMIDDADGGIGVTFYSKYPKQNVYCFKHLT